MFLFVTFLNLLLLLGTVMQGQAKRHREKKQIGKKVTGIGLGLD